MGSFVLCNFHGHSGAVGAGPSTSINNCNLSVNAKPMMKEAVLVAQLVASNWPFAACPIIPYDPTFRKHQKVFIVPRKSATRVQGTCSIAPAVFRSSRLNLLAGQIEWIGWTVCVFGSRFVGFRVDRRQTPSHSQRQRAREKEKGRGRAG